MESDGYHKLEDESSTMIDIWTNCPQEEDQHEPEALSTHMSTSLVNREVQVSGVFSLLFDIFYWNAWSSLLCPLTHSTISLDRSQYIALHDTNSVNLGCGGFNVPRWLTHFPESGTVCTVDTPSMIVLDLGSSALQLNLEITHMAAQQALWQHLDSLRQI